MENNQTTAEKIGFSIKEERDKKGLTQQQLSEELCISIMQISNWENNRAVPSRNTQKRLKKYFGLPL